jgi:hypothetical protein
MRPEVLEAKMKSILMLLLALPFEAFAAFPKTLDCQDPVINGKTASIVMTTFKTGRILYLTQAGAEAMLPLTWRPSQSSATQTAMAAKLDRAEFTILFENDYLSTLKPSGYMAAKDTFTTGEISRSYLVVCQRLK